MDVVHMQKREFPCRGEAQENEEEDGDMMMGDDNEEATDDADFEGPQESGQDLPYSGGQNVVSIHLIP